MLGNVTIMINAIEMINYVVKSVKYLIYLSLMTTLTVVEEESLEGIVE